MTSAASRRQQHADAFAELQVYLIEDVVAALWVVDGNHSAALQQVRPDSSSTDHTVLVEVDIHVLAKATAVVVAHLQGARQHTRQALSSVGSEPRIQHVGRTLLRALFRPDTSPRTRAVGWQDSAHQACQPLHLGHTAAAAALCVDGTRQLVYAVRRPASMPAIQ